MGIELTKEEKRAIAALNRLAKRWPSTLWIFANGGGASVLKKSPDGDQVTLPHGGFDQGHIVATIPSKQMLIEGGDW